MKKLSLFIIALFTIGGFWSCSNEEDPFVQEPVEKKNISFNVIGFEEEVVPFKKSLKAGESNIVNGLTYFIWNKEDYKLVTKNTPHSDELTGIISPNEDGTFSITETLPVGEYYMSIIAASNIESVKFQHEVAGEIPGWGLYNYPNSGIISSKLNSDVFGKTFEFEVGESAVVENIILPRIVGKVEVVIKDAKLAPAEVNSIQLFHNADIPHLVGSHMHRLPMGWMFKGGKTLMEQGFRGTEVIFPIISREEMLQADEVKYSLYMFPTSNIWNSDGTDTPGEYEGTLSSLRIRINGTNGEKIITKNLKVYRNKITRYSGNIFSGDPSFNVQVGEEWGEVINEEF